MTDQYRKSIYLPWDADHSNAEWWDETPCNIQEEIEKRQNMPRIIRWLQRAWCWLFGHRIRTYLGGYTYKAMKGNLFGGRKGQEKRPQRYYKHVTMREGYCRCCGKHFSASYIKKHKIR